MLQAGGIYIGTESERTNALVSHKYAIFYATDTMKTFVYTGATWEEYGGGGGAHPDLAAHDTLGLATQAELDGHVGAADPHTGYQRESEKDAASGYPGIDTNSRLILARLPLADSDGKLLVRRSGVMAYDVLLDADIPAVIARDAEVTTAVTNHEGAADPHTGYQRESEKGAASGYAGLDSTTKVPTAQLGSGVADSTTFLRGDQVYGAPTASVADPNPQSYTPGSFTVPTGKYVIIARQLQITTTQQVNLQGSACLRMN